MWRFGRRVAQLAVTAAAGFFVLPVAVAAAGNPLVWGTVPSPNASSLGDVLWDVSAVSQADAWAVGEFNPGVPPTVTGRRTLTEHWNGTTWTVVPSPNAFATFQASYLRGVEELAGNDVWAAGWGYDFNRGTTVTLILHYNGSQWSIVASPSSGTNQLSAVEGVAFNDVWAVGGSPDAFTPLTLHWNGRSWTTVATACRSMLTGLVTIASNDAWAVGQPATSCHWNGSTWTAVPVPRSGLGIDRLWAVDASSATDVWAVGESELDTPTGAVLSPIVEHWNGVKWVVMTSAPGMTLHGVEALSATNVWAVGTDQQFFGLVDHWNGSSWTSTPSPRPGVAGRLLGIEAPTPTSLWGVGSLHTGASDSTERTLVEQAPSLTQGTLTGTTSAPNATVSWTGPARGSTTSGVTGMYSAAGLPAGTYTVFATKSGCAPDAATVHIVAGAFVTQNFTVACGG